MARNGFIANYLDQMEKLDQTLTWFSLSDNVIRKVLEKYFLRENIDSESKTLLKRYNICRIILLNRELVYDEDTLHELMTLCPNNHWEFVLREEFEYYDPFNPIHNSLEMLTELKRVTFYQFQKCDGFAQFRHDVLIKSYIIIELLSQTYDEINNIDQ